MLTLRNPKTSLDISACGCSAVCNVTFSCSLLRQKHLQRKRNCRLSFIHKKLSSNHGVMTSGVAKNSPYLTETIRCIH